MAAALSMSRATIVRSDQPEPLTRVSLLVRSNVATIRRGREVLQVADVSTVENVTRESWRVTLAGGETWDVKRERNCGCGS